MRSGNHKPSEDTIVSLRNAALRIRQRLILPNTDWRIKRNESWVIMGPNGAGKTTLVRALTGEVPVVRGSVWPPDTGSFRKRFAYVSFDQHRHLLAREDRLDAARWYSGNIYEQTLVKDFLSRALPANIEEKDMAGALAGLQGEDLLHHAVRHLSSGEMRKVLIARALLRKPEILILDEPYNGLDSEAFRLFGSLIDHLIAGSVPIILVTHRVEEIPPRATHLLGVKKGRIVFQGPRDEIFRSGHLDALYSEEDRTTSELPSDAITTNFSEPASTHPEPLVEIRGATVRYRQKPVIKRLEWTILEGQNWALLGPNGSGKTTLLNLMYGDHPQVYANRVYMFGRRRGSGETVWEIKDRIGLVSAELQMRYRKPVTALEAVISGFFDAIGLYRKPTVEQSEIALKWMRVIGIGHLASKRFEWLSTGQQRLVLIARAMVKSPRLLMLDEPVQGLDPLNRKRVLAAADAVSNKPTISLIFVSHYPDALPATISHVMTLTPTDDGSTGRISTRNTELL